MRFDLQTLELFVAVCEETSISRAAERSNTAPPAISKRISLLETALNLGQFLNLYPAVRVDLEEDTSREIVLAVIDNAADIGIYGGMSQRRAWSPVRTTAIA